MKWIREQLEFPKVGKFAQSIRNELQCEEGRKVLQTSMALSLRVRVFKAFILFHFQGKNLSLNEQSLESRLTGVDCDRGTRARACRGR